MFRLILGFVWGFSLSSLLWACFKYDIQPLHVLTTVYTILSVLISSYLLIVAAINE